MLYDFAKKWRNGQQQQQHALAGMQSEYVILWGITTEYKQWGLDDLTEGIIDDATRKEQEHYSKFEFYKQEE